MKAVVDLKELEAFLSYLEDKTDEVYQNEVKQAVKRFLSEQVAKLDGSDVVKGG